MPKDTAEIPPGDFRLTGPHLWADRHGEPEPETRRIAISAEKSLGIEKTGDTPTESLPLKRSVQRDRTRGLPIRNGDLDVGFVTPAKVSFCLAPCAETACALSGACTPTLHVCTYFGGGGGGHAENLAVLVRPPDVSVRWPKRSESPRRVQNLNGAELALRTLEACANYKGVTPDDLPPVSIPQPIRELRASPPDAWPAGAERRVARQLRPTAGHQRLAGFEPLGPIPLCR